MAVRAARTKVKKLETWHTYSNGPATVRALKSLPDDVQDQLTETSWSIAQESADVIHAAAMGDDKQSRMVAPSIYAVMKKYPTVLVGGSIRVPGHGATRYGDVFGGANFGTLGAYPQFRAKLGPDQDYWFLETFWDESPRMLAAWSKAVDDIVEAYAATGEA